MPTYEVVKPCYVPLGSGVKYRVPGQVVTLDVEEAKNLDGYVRPTVAQVTVRNPVQKLDTAPTVQKLDAAAPTVQKLDTPKAGTTVAATKDQEVDSDVGDPQAGDE